MLKQTLPEHTETITSLASIINRHVNYWKSLGYPEARLNAIFGDFYSELDNPKGRIPIELTNRAMSDVIRYFDDSSIPFRSGFKISYSALNAFGHLLLTCPSIRDVVSMAIQFQKIGSVGYQSLLIEGETESSFDFMVPSYSAFSEIQLEMTMGVAVRILKEAVDTHSFNMQIDFQHENKKLEEKCQSICGIQINTRSARNRIRFNTEMLDEPFNRSDVSVFESSRASNKRWLKSMGPESHFPVLCEDIIMDYMGSGSTKIEFLAKALQVNKRTIQLRLAENGMTFRDVLKAARLKKAQYFIEKAYPVKEIAQELEFSSRKAFYESFERTKGIKLQQYIGDLAS